MARTSPKCPTHKDNHKRKLAKNKIGYGLMAIPDGMTVVKWGQKHDPLFKIKGKERHRRSYGISTI